MKDLSKLLPAEDRLYTPLETDQPQAEYRDNTKCSWCGGVGEHTSWCNLVWDTHDSH